MSAYVYKMFLVFFFSEVKALMSHLHEIHESLWHHRFCWEFSSQQCTFFSVVKMCCSAML